MLQTNNGKEIQIYTTNTGLYKLRFASGGQLPKEFNGSFTRREQAEQAATKYINSKSAVKEVKKTDK